MELSGGIINLAVFISSDGDTATVIVNSLFFVIKNIIGSLVWDFGGIEQRTFTYIGEVFTVTAGAFTFHVTYDGLGSLLFTLDNFLSSSSCSSSSSLSSSSPSSSSSSFSSSTSSSSSSNP